MTARACLFGWYSFCNKRPAEPTSCAQLTEVKTPKQSNNNFFISVCRLKSLRTSEGGQSAKAIKVLKSRTDFTDFTDSSAINLSK